MKAYFRWYDHNYEVISPSTKKAKAYCATFAAHSIPYGITLDECYANPSHRKRVAYSELLFMFSYTTITSFNCQRFTAMSTLDGLNALFIDTGVNCYVVADRTELKKFAEDLQVTFCEYREEK